MKKFEPIITQPTGSTLKEKAVNVKGNDGFGRLDVPDIPKTAEVKKEEPKEQSVKKTAPKEKKLQDLRFKASMTQKISPAVNLKLNTLKPFFTNEKMTANDVFDLLIDTYIEEKLTDRQKAAFKAMYEMQLDMMKK